MANAYVALSSYSWMTWSDRQGRTGNLTIQPIDAVKVSIPQETDWSIYRACDKCQAEVGKPCWDIRCSNPPKQYQNFHPHRFRQRRQT